MATVHSPSVQALRAIVHRIASSDPRQLAQSAAQIASSLAVCKPLLTASADSLKSGDATLPSLLHRFRTALTSLLQARDVESRWAAVVLVKAAIEAGRLEILRSSGEAWLRGLLAILKKSRDPPTCRVLAAITLTRIFTLTWPHPNLVRELTTPNLPAFISTCLKNFSNARCSDRERETVLAAFCTLLPRHPTVFRSHEQQIRPLLLQILASTSSDSSDYDARAHASSAQRLFVLLHHCAPKQGAAEKWGETFRATLTAAHTTCDRVFRSLMESWTSRADVVKANGFAFSAAEPELDGDMDALGLRSWKGIYSGCDRLVTLLHLLRSHMEYGIAGTLTFRVGLVIDLLARLLSASSSLQPNPEFSKDEREALFLSLPPVHRAALDIIHTLLFRFGNSLLSVHHELLELITGAFTVETTNDNRAMSYKVVGQLLELLGPSLQKADVAELAPFMKACAEDLLHSSNVNAEDGSLQSNGSAPTKESSQSAKIALSHNHSNLYVSSSSLISRLFVKIHPAAMPRKIRVQIERAAVLTRHREAMVACVMNPSSHKRTNALQPSLLPLVARTYPGINEVEAIMRPRMPALIGTRRDAESEGVNGFESNESGEEKDEDTTRSGQYEPQDERHPDQIPLKNGAQSDIFVDQELGDAKQVEEEELYTSTPPAPGSNGFVSSSAFARPNSNSQPASSNALKRAASLTREESELESTKRLRASPVTDALIPEAAPPLSAPSDALSTTTLPPQGAQGSQQPAPPAVETSLNLNAADSAMQQESLDDDGSDFEIPELNMDPDTDDEAEFDEDG